MAPGPSEPRTVLDLLERGAPEAPAIGAPGGATPLRYRELRALAARTVETLNGAGIGRGDRVAMVLPNGPEAAAAFACVAAGATAAPLNPAYRAEDFEFHFRDLGARALLVRSGVASPAREVAARLGIPLVELEPQPERGAGAFALHPPASPRGKAALPGPGEADDVALVLHTSGTTSRPKIVPLLQRNLLATTRHIGATLALQPGDVCLNIMPLFHIHGLMAAVLSSLAAGAEVCCAPGFDAFRFFLWIDEARPTWYTAVPTMHQAVLARASGSRRTSAANGIILARSRLRLVRSSSASLLPQVMKELEQAFRAPVIESYGMTETAHQMTSNPLPPGARKPGSVGVAAGPEVSVMDAEGRLLPSGETGEVVIRGPNVTPGYESDPAANARAFTRGWFRTGDQGVVDGEGYLRITGRLKEIINRGGEKISPLEVDEALQHHPAVLQVVTFALPHPLLGEEVAAAVVLREGHDATERELRNFAADRLAPHMVPRHVVFVAEIPKGASGKLQRIGLAARLGLAT
ncbi:MAG TPA: acyl--CoA ligase [Anaeromyxobacteraceae bacterium]|nr:acyl--CoA ligase [Anaeromyxobacteraceae bacterium]